LRNKVDNFVSAK